MQELEAATQRLEQGQSLDPEAARACAAALADEAVPAEAKARLLCALHKKGETVEEVVAFAQVFREHAAPAGLQDWQDEAVDIVGTGGTGSKTYNFSSAASLVVAAAGVPVIKHGNRAVTSQSGAADFLGTLGVPLELSEARRQASMRTLNFCFLFAPAFHPAFKSIVPVRKQLAADGQATVFNILGPLLNPAQPRRQLLGVPERRWLEPLAQALSALGVRRGWAVLCMLPGGALVDEWTTAGENHAVGIGDLAEARWVETLTSLGLRPAEPAALRGGTPEENVALLHAMTEGNGPTALIESICLNAGVALELAEHVDSLRDGVALARETLQGGRLKEWLAGLRDFYAKG